MSISRILSFCFALALIPQFAIASHAKDLKTVIDEYNYAMTVEWDQKDMSFALEQNALLTQELTDLLKDGMSAESFKKTISEITNVDMTNVEAELAFIDLKNPSAMESFIKLKAAKGYKRGASWDMDGNLQAITLSLLLISCFLLVTLELLDYKKDVKL